MVHKVVAVGSRSLAKAQFFIDTIAGGDTSITAYGSYEEVYADKVKYSIPKSSEIVTRSNFQAVDVIYIGAHQSSLDRNLSFRFL